jgi:TRAP-type uncharacterized transport system fused permease subunit
MISFITPPVAIASIVAAGLAGTDNMKTGLYSLRLGFVAYVVPFFFIYNPVLVGVGSMAAIVYTTVMSFFGIILISAGIEGFLFRLGHLGWVSRWCLIILGLLFFFPALMLNLMGALALCLLLGIVFLSRRISERKAEGGRHPLPGGSDQGRVQG